MSHSNDFLLTDWTETASWYVEEYGWEVIPLHPNPDFSKQSSSDEVVQHLGYAPLWDNWEEKASCDVAMLQEWGGLTRGPGERLPHVYLGAKTGSVSNLVVLEVTLDERGRALIERWQQACASLPETLTLFEGRDRKFYFFTFPDVEGMLPRWFGGPSVRLHGESSLVRVPILNKRRSKLSWNLHGPEEPAVAPSWLLDHFGCLAQGGSGARSIGEHGSATRSEAAEEWGSGTESSARSSASSSTVAEPSPSQNGSVHRALPFRTGESLACEASPDPHFLGQPWLVEDGLTVLTGTPKLAGKTTWALHAAAHLVSGRDFMGFPSRPSPVVLLTDVSPKGAQVQLQDLGVCEPTPRSRLHLLHPKDVCGWHWSRLLGHTYRYAEQVGAKAIFIDSLDQYVSVQGGPDPTTDKRVLHQLSVEPPPGAAVFAVKATQVGKAVSARTTVEQLADLGATADVVIQMARPPSSAQSTVRRFVSLSRGGRVPHEMYGDLQQGRYERIPRDRITEDNWLPTASEDSSSRDARSPAPPLRTQDLEETTSIN